MKTKITLLILFVCSVLSTNLTAQDVVLDWVKQMGDTNLDRGNSIATDTSGNVYTTGSFWGTVDFDPGYGTTNLISNGMHDVFIQKLDVNGNLLWVKQMGGLHGEDAVSITIGPNGTVYTMGTFRLTVDFDPNAGTTNLTSNGPDDIFIQKLDANGNLLWVNQLGGTDWDRGGCITTDSNGNVFLTGKFGGTVDFDPGAGTLNLTSNGSYDVFVQKLNANGNLLWVKQIGGTDWDNGMSITTDTYGNVYTMGYFKLTVDFDPNAGTTNLTSNGDNDIFIQKLDSNGGLLWVKQMGGTTIDNARSITIDASGNVYSTGDFTGTVDFDSGSGTTNLTSSGSFDIFVQKLDPSGNLLWVKQMGGTNLDISHSIITDINGNVYTTGSFRLIADFDPNAGTLNLTSNGLYDIFIQKLDTSGNLLWVKQMGGTDNDIGNSISTDASGNVYSTGYFGGTVDFDPGNGASNLTSNGSQEIFIQKLSPCQNTYAFDVKTDCNSYTWIDGNTYTASNNTATHTLTNISGCDSVVTLDLTILNSATGTAVVTSCDSYTWIDAINYTSNNNTASYNIVGGAANGCDSLVLLNLTINSVSDVTVSVNSLTITANNTNGIYQWLDCNNNNSVIANGTNQSFTATVNGAYAVEITENGCVDTSDCVAITTVGLIENSVKESFLIYPNPTIGQFKIVFENVISKVEISIVSINGELIKKSTYNNTDVIDIKIEQPSGIYILEIKTPKGIQIIKVVKM